ncbi:hypothetical protein D3C87_517510 [compost metagenome]
MKINHIVILLCLTLTLACKFNVSQKNKPSDQNAAKEITNSFYSDLASGNKTALYALFGETQKFTKSQMKDMLDLTLSTITTKYGSIASYKVKNVETNVDEKDVNGGIYNVTFEVLRENRRYIDTFKLTRQSGEIKITDYFVTPQ